MRIHLRRKRHNFLVFVIALLMFYIAYLLNRVHQGFIEELIGELVKFLFPQEIYDVKKKN
jgi:hypothetical protein